MARIPTCLAKKLVLNYDKKEIGKGAGGVWFHKDALIEALTTPVIRKRIDGTGEKEVMPDGLRFYFAKYEKHLDPPTRVPKHKKEGNKKTLVIVPTVKEDEDTGLTKVPHPYRPGEFVHHDLLVSPNDPPEYPKPEDSLKFMIEGNDGQICPPPPVTGD